MPFFETKDHTHIFYNDWGSGPPVVLIHGWPLNGDMWEYQAGVLASSGFRVIVPDRRGFGRSGQPWSGYDYDTMSDDVAGLLEHLDLQGAALVGFSMGGGEVVRTIARHGTGRVAKAVLVASVVPYLLKGPSNPDGADPSIFEGMMDGLSKDRPGFLSDFGKKLFGVGLISSPVSQGILEWSLMMAMQASKKATLDCVRAFSGTDFRPDLARVTVPALVIHGDDDSTVPIDISGRKAAAGLPQARLIVYEGAPHGLFYTERDRLNADLLAFLKP